MQCVRGFLLVFVSAVGLAIGCGGTPEVPNSEGSGATGGGGAANKGGASNSTGGTVIHIPEGGEAGMGPGSGGASGDDCATVSCGEGQRCEQTNGEGVCVDNTCADLNCKATEECLPATGGGFVCTSIACDSDVDCPISRYCDGTKCVDDVCEPDTRTCDGNDVLVCASNGGANPPAYTCGSAGYFDSVCSDGAGASSAGCGCEGDWDCPPFTACEVGVCKGTGVEPTCTLPPTPFKDVLPKLEFRWGGASSASPNATGKSFPWSAQVGSTPVVINLDDDNGDGRINELDFPELVFMSYYGDNPDDEGVVRAVHGGGTDANGDSKKGLDFFALCGTRHWLEGEPIATDCNTADTNAESRTAALGRASGMLAAGDLDGDGVPEIVVPLEGGAIQILNNRGEIITTSATNLWPSGNLWHYPAPAIANLDFDGLAEIVVGNRVVTLTKDANGALAVDRVFTGQLTAGTMHHFDDEAHHGPSVCLADLVSAPGLEIVAGTTLYRLPDAANCTTQPNSDYCRGRLTAVWDAPSANPGATFLPAPPLTPGEGFCAVADVLGADPVAAPGPQNPIDGVPEVLVMADGHLLILKADDGKLLRDINLGGGTQGGAPNVDDFDGDGFPEIAIALSDFYTVVDLQQPEATHCPAWNAVLRQGQDPPGTNPARDPGGKCTRDNQCNAGAVCNQKAGQCVCLQSGWKRDTEDDSSKVTSSSVFDFNGDGAAEVIYNDECYFRVYDGGTGGVYLQLPSLSRTIIENPVVADIDNDGNAEIAFVQNNETAQCGDLDDPRTNPNRSSLNSWPNGVDDVPIAGLPNGLEVWGDPSDVWVAARRVWNEHGYHVTNVTEGGQIPVHEPESWKPLNGRFYDTYRSQPRNYGVAPDLTLTAIQISSPNVACGELSNEIEISVLVKNAGDLRVGPGVQISFSGAWANPALSAALEDASGAPITVTLTKSLEPGASTIVTVSYQAGNNGRSELPGEVTAVVDAEGAERECHEDNNEITGPIEPGEALPDLRLVFGTATGCAAPKAKITVYNDGAAPAENVLVRIYAGDPSQGGQVIGETTIPGPIAPGESVAVTVTLEELRRKVTLYGLADPLDVIHECNDANNLAKGPELDCEPVAR